MVLKPELVSAVVRLEEVSVAGEIEIVSVLVKGVAAVVKDDISVVKENGDFSGRFSY